VLFNRRMRKTACPVVWKGTGRNPRCPIQSFFWPGVVKGSPELEALASVPGMGENYPPSHTIRGLEETWGLIE